MVSLLANSLFMRLHRFFIEEHIGQLVYITITSVQLIHQWRKVFRYTIESTLVLFDSSGSDYVCKIEYIEDTEARLKVIEVREVKNTSKREIFLCAAVVKKDTFEWILEKGTELGAARFVPILSERSEKKSLNFERAKKILIESTEQCGRAVVPRIYEIIKFEDAVTEYSSFKSVAWDPTGVDYSRHEIPSDGPLCVYIGPEGGWSPRELEIFKENKIPILSVGNFTLRAETAAVAILSLLLL